MKTWISGLAILMIISVTITGCKLYPAGDKVSDSAESASIKVMNWDEAYFNQQYGGTFSLKYPKIDVKVTPMESLYNTTKDMNSAFYKFLDTEKPDVLMLNESQYQEMAAMGKLLDLEPLIQRDSFDTEGMLSSVVQMLKEKGEGFYGLSPTFNSQALFYNKTLFDLYGIPYPRNGMTWEDVFRLAERFDSKEAEGQKIYGFSQNSPSLFNLLINVGNTQGMNIVDPTTMQLTIRTDGWKRSFQIVTDAYRKNSIYLAQFGSGGEKYEDFLKQNLFAVGRSAMTAETPFMINSINQAKEVLKDIPAFDWELVTVPIDPSNPSLSHAFSLSYIFAISVDSPQPEAAWKLVQHINSDETAKIQSKSTKALLTRVSYSKEREGRSLEPFYALKPNSNLSNNGFDRIPNSFFQKFATLAEEELRNVVGNKKTVDEALAALQSKGQEELSKAIAEKEQ
ncbi:extracellular solute-binding protein [Paenibacillus sedimenti]|uniref:Extracellular solute-binding protein n=1 Tax=Paenibacillus sedimenti TaxID=2770274 RepID=A0A926QIK5_9BACL|nr:extracellular solute-binding protein [Paenibacillus sedimenti]MBD0379614.1 extracellular solute-binding protein [Paenibacillus sedimenti]